MSQGAVLDQGLGGGREGTTKRREPALCKGPKGARAGLLHVPSLPSGLQWDRNRTDLFSQVKRGKNSFQTTASASASPGNHLGLSCLPKHAADPRSQRTGSWAGSGGSRILVLHTDSTDLKSRALLSLEPHRLLCSPIHGLLGGAWTQMAWATKALTRRSPALTSVGGCERRGYLPAQKLPLNLASNNRPTRPHLTRKLLFSA